MPHILKLKQLILGGSSGRLDHKLLFACFCEGFLPTCLPSLLLNTELHLKYTMYTGVELLQILYVELGKTRKYS